MASIIVELPCRFDTDCRLAVASFRLQDNAEADVAQPAAFGVPNAVCTTAVTDQTNPPNHAEGLAHHSPGSRNAPWVVMNENVPRTPKGCKNIARGQRRGAPAKRHPGSRDTFPLSSLLVPKGTKDSPAQPIKRSSGIADCRSRIPDSPSIVSTFLLLDVLTFARCDVSTFLHVCSVLTS